MRSLGYVVRQDDWWKPIVVTWLFAIGGYYTGKNFATLFQAYDEEKRRRR